MTSSSNGASLDAFSAEGAQGTQVKEYQPPDAEISQALGKAK